eukprot:Skav213426  [mRNA]  locus=scaffold38:329281:345740:- [translate_table: standard]
MPLASVLLRSRVAFRPTKAPPLEPAPALGSSSMDNRSQNPMMSSLQSTSPSVAGGLGKGSRKASSMTEKAAPATPFPLLESLRPAPHGQCDVLGPGPDVLDPSEAAGLGTWALQTGAEVQNVWFETLSMIMLITNAVIIGVQTDYMAVNKLPSTPWTLRAFDIWFCCFFSVEITLRILAHGRRFFSMNGCAWNMMDLGLVTAYVAETVLMIAAEDQDGCGCSTAECVAQVFEGVTGGVDWHQIADPLIEGISPWFGLLFIGFMGFCILALLNVITGAEKTWRVGKGKLQDGLELERELEIGQLQASSDNSEQDTNE